MFRVVVYSLLVAEAPTVVVIDEAVELARPTATTVLDEAEGVRRERLSVGNPTHETSAQTFTRGLTAQGSGLSTVECPTCPSQSSGNGSRTAIHDCPAEQSLKPSQALSNTSDCVAASSKPALE